MSGPPPYSYLPSIDNAVLWCISDDWLPRIQAALMQDRLEAFLKAEQSRMLMWPLPWEMENGYVLRGDQAIIPLEGVLSPYGFFGFGSTKGFQTALDHAVNNNGVRSIEVRINSPGGLLEGTREAALDLRTASKIKPTTTRFEGMGTSGAMYIGSQSRHVTAGSTSWLGNVGVRSLLVDSSKLYSDAGVKVIPLVTGKFKAIGLPGVEITEEQIEHLQSMVDDAMQMFIGDLTEARDFSSEQLESVKTGAVYSAEQAKSIGLIDEVEDADLLSANTGGMNMSEQVADLGAMQKFLSALKLRVVPEAEGPTPGPEDVTINKTSSIGPTMPPKTFEQGVQEGVDAMREEAIEILQLCTLGDPKQAVVAATAALQDKKRPAQVREELATERALNAVRDDKGDDIPEVDTAHVRPVAKATTKLPSAYEMAAKRDRMAANYGRES